MIGFGFADNFIMILAGDVIDNKLGVLFGFSTLAAAGLGNLISDVAGISLGEAPIYLPACTCSTKTCMCTGHSHQREETPVCAVAS